MYFSLAPWAKSYLLKLELMSTATVWLSYKPFILREEDWAICLPETGVSFLDFLLMLDVVLVETMLAFLAGMAVSAVPLLQSLTLSGKGRENMSCKEVNGEKTLCHGDQGQPWGYWFLKQDINNMSDVAGEHTIYLRNAKKKNKKTSFKNGIEKFTPTMGMADCTCTCYGTLFLFLCSLTM